MASKTVWIIRARWQMEAQTERLRLWLPKGCCYGAV